MAAISAISLVISFLGPLRGQPFDPHLLQQRCQQIKTQQLRDVQRIQRVLALHEMLSTGALRTEHLTPTDTLVLDSRSPALARW